MKEPLRWKNDPDAPPEARELLDQAAQTAPMPPEVYASLASQIATPGAVTTAAATSSVLAKTTIFLTVSAASAGAVWVASQGDPPPSVERVDRAEPERAAPAPVTEAQHPVAAPPIDDRAVVETPPAATAPARPRAAPRPVRAARPRASTAPARPRQDLVAEARLLEKARRYAASEPKRALQLLRTHAARFTEGALAAEREVLAIEVLGRLGQTEAQRRRARAFLKRYLHSPYADRVRQVLRE